jgi:regulator of replication initiation timing
MSTLSHKIIQLMAYESQLKELKKEIVSQNAVLLTEQDNQILKDSLKEKMQKYEAVSERYGNLFKDILQDSTKMKEEYLEVKKEGH